MWNHVKYEHYLEYLHEQMQWDFESLAIFVNKSCLAVRTLRYFSFNWQILLLNTSNWNLSRWIYCWERYNSCGITAGDLLVTLFQGPIVGFTFGAIIKNQNLWRISIRNELIGLLICVFFGWSTAYYQFCFFLLKILCFCCVMAKMTEALEMAAE